MPYAAPVIVVPGITATQLRDEYVLPPDIVWSAVMKKEYERIALHPDNIRFDVFEPARIAPDYIFEIAYKELVNELRHDLREQEDKPVPVFPFSYDWRQMRVKSNSGLICIVTKLCPNCDRKYRNAQKIGSHTENREYFKGI